jgi:hypothetical protein
MAVDGLKHVALAVGLMLVGVSSQAEPVSSKLPARPAPVSGRISNDPAAVALRPAAAMPVVATSTARQVPPPSNPNEPLFKDEAATAHVASTGAATGTGAGTTPIPASTMPAATPPASTGIPKAAAPAHVASAVRGKRHVDHTEGKKLAESTKGRKKTGKAAGHEHADKTDGAGRKKLGGHGKDAAVAGKMHVSSAQAKTASPKHQAASHRSGRATNVGRHGKGTAHVAARSPVQAVSTAHELKPASARKKHAAARQTAAGKRADVKAHSRKMAEQAQAKHKAAPVHAKAGHQLAAKSVARADKPSVKAVDKASKKAARKATRTTAAV